MEWSRWDMSFAAQDAARIREERLRREREQGDGDTAMVNTILDPKRPEKKAQQPEPATTLDPPDDYLWGV
jgi:hypothetical protein